MSSNQNEAQYVAADDCYVFNCPHCENPVQVRRNQVNCQIFRHGQMKNTYDLRLLADDTVTRRVPLVDISHESAFIAPGTIVQVRRTREGELEPASVLKVNEGQQVNSHAPQAHCDRLVANSLIWGCGKPFRLFFDGNGMVTHVAKCGYV